jgi:hypothetical protein
VTLKGIATLYKSAFKLQTYEARQGNAGMTVSITLATTVTINQQVYFSVFTLKLPSFRHISTLLCP